MNPYPVLVRADDGVVTLTGEIDFTDPANQPGSAGLPGSTALRGPFAFTHLTPGLAAGVAMFTPKIGDVIVDAWIVTDIAFDGTTPKVDFGTFNGGNAGLFAYFLGSGPTLAAVDVAVTDNAGILAGAHVTEMSLSSALIAAELSDSDFGRWQLTVTAANPLLLVASQDGNKGGTALDSTVGAARLYVLMATPLGS